MAHGLQVIHARCERLFIDRDNVDAVGYSDDDHHQRCDHRNAVKGKSEVVHSANRADRRK